MMSDSQMPLRYAIWRHIHLGATFWLCLLATPDLPLLAEHDSEPADLTLFRKP